MADPEEEGDEPVESPPEGAVCSEHPERPALAVCPRCGAYACLSCWHHPIKRCQSCLMRDPASAAPPIPWEDKSVAWPMRFVGTLANAARPRTTAPALAREGVAPAIVFALLTFPPLAALAGIVPATRTLLFGEGRIQVVGDGSGADIALDVARAAGIGLVACTVLLLALALPYVSIVRSYSQSAPAGTPIRAMAYRAFLLPLAGCVTSLALFMMTESTSALVAMVWQLATVIPVVLLFTNMQAAARSASGTGPLVSLLAALVPSAVAYVAWLFLVSAIAPWMPDAEETRAAMQSARQIFP